MVRKINEPCWQREQSEKKRKRSFKAFKLWLLLFGLLIFLGLGFKIYRILKDSLWDGKNRISFVVKGEKIILCSFGAREMNLTLIQIPKGTFLLVSHGYGRYPVEAIPSLEDLEKKKDLLAETIQENFGVPIGGWIEIVNSKLKIVNSKLKIVNSKEGILDTLATQIKGDGKTNFSRWDLIRLWWGIRKVRGGEIEVLDLAKLNVFSEKELPDGTKVFEIDPVRLDPYIQKFLGDSLIKKENFSIEVLNGTTFSGLAENGARLLSNIGGEVVSIGNSEVQSAPAEQGLASPEKCKVQSAKNKKESYTIRKILKIWDCTWEEKKEEGKAEITLILGEDYWQKLNQK